ncbi:hypothetical protein [Pontibacter pamirensis]|uniref:hypothetical protein n=1 Tax=Pontibacter pamirensis TaxID=2562824 RepID=UPI0013898B58|nr:hypothetical protein [Pontibacter pamirensis]
MLPFYTKFKELCQTQVTGLGLSIFRVFFSLILLVEVAKVFYFRHLYFDPTPYIVEAELSFSLVLLVWLGVLFFLLIGFFTRTAALINYVLVLVFFSSFTTIKYHFDAALVGLSFLLIILPMANTWSVDSFLYQLQRPQRGEQKVRKVYYFLPVLLVLCLQYVDSFFHKAASAMWLKGLGVWLPASLPNQIYTAHSWLLNQEELITGLGYLVMLFELLFIFLLPFGKIRSWLALIGVSMHLGIVLTFPIPSFGLTFAGVYMLLLPDSFWSRIRGKVGSRSNSIFALHRFSWLKPFLVAVPEGGRVEQEANGYWRIKREDVKVKLLYFFTCYLVLAQLIKLLQAPLVINASEHLGTSTLRYYTAKAFLPLEVINAKLLGVTENLVYTGFEEGSYNILAVEYVAPNKETVWLPIIDRQGKASTYSFGRMFTKWSQTIGAYPQDTVQVKDGLVKFTAFWAAKHNIPLQDATFRVLSKETIVQFNWEEDFLQKQMNRPWREIGRLRWENNQPRLLLH